MISVVSRALLSCSLALGMLCMPTQAQTSLGTSVGVFQAAPAMAAGAQNAGGAATTATATTAARAAAAAAAAAVRNKKNDKDSPEAAPVAYEAVPSKFQSFVQESTGRLLPMYGSELFDGSRGYTPDAALPAPAEYILGPGDEVNVQVWGAVDQSGAFTIDRNGQISLPKVGTFSLAGVTVRDLENVLRGQVSKVFTNFSLSASLGHLRSIQVYVVGQARQPGTYTLSSLSTLVNALFASGGPTSNGSMRNIQLTRRGKVVTTLDMYDFIARGDKGRDLPLQSGDVIVIPPVGPRIAVTGAFDQAAIYELKGKTTVGDILSLSGGVPVIASTQKALIERVDPTQNVPRQVNDLRLDEAGLKTVLNDGDVVSLLGISVAFANAVTLQGTVAAPLRYRWFEGMKILDLIPEVDALITADYYSRKNLLVQNVVVAKAAGAKVNDRVRSAVDQINWEYAIIERLNRSTLSPEIIPFNLEKVVLEHDPANNIELQSGDVVTILSQNDLRLPQERQSRLVRVEGEVAAPGVYQVQAGETLPQLLRRMGGLTAQAYIYGTEFTRESVRRRQQENLDSVINRLEAQSNAQASYLAANARAESAAAELEQQQAQLKSQIERLRSMRSNGRVALELDTSASNIDALPEVALEDGDHIVVPSTPSFVAAIGSVNNENVLLYKRGKTVSEVLKSAGLTEDAEPSEAFVVRADGSIVARRDHSGFFGGSFESLALMPGDTVVVPAQINRESKYTFMVRSLKDWTQILANFGLGVAAIKLL